MTTRRSVDLPPPREDEPPLPANVREFPLVVGPHIVLAIMLRQRERATEKVVARDARRKGAVSVTVCSVT
jgi:hypothetical protein